MPSKQMTPTRSPTKRFSLASSASQPRASVHFDQETIVSRPETIKHTPINSPRRRRRSIVLPPTPTLIPDIYPPTPISPLKRRFSAISPPFHDEAHDLGISASHRKRRFSGVSSETKNSSSSYSRTQKLSTMPPSSNKPPPQVCGEVNQRIRSLFNYPDFDFVQHVQHRSYAVRTQHFDKSECVTMLDAGVDNLLQRMFEQLPRQPDTSMNISIRASPGKGLGMFSRKQISNGERFLFEYPTLITPYVVGLSLGLSELYEDIFGRLSGPVFRELMSLSSSSSSLTSGEKKDVHEAIMRVNALAIELPVPGGEFPELNTHRAIFLQTSRCNHSCGPNARWEWDPNRFSLILTAIRPIQEGEEITIPYIAPNMLRKERQEVLYKLYGFKCSCPFCAPPDNNIRQSDLVCSTLASTWTGRGGTSIDYASGSTFAPSLPPFETWCLDPTFPDDILINAHLHALHLIEFEKSDISININTIRGSGSNTHARDIGRHLDAIAMCYGALEDVDNFRMWMERVSEVRVRSKPEHVIVFKKWLSNPRTFPVWGWRKAFCGGEERNGEGSGDLSACVSMGMFECI